MGDYIEVEEGSSKSLDINFSRTDKVIDSNIDIILNSLINRNKNISNNSGIHVINFRSCCG